ncbi:2-dehydro-3-deoxygluconokinase [Mucilaginibacter frigoritolerans]|uniref:2-dehydro-3-deoxygluconokinase n=1 Tax=Mucilaginibacter frigoritolerans TaxID=652788 RepID=A0A562TPU2_9SPHI|nr:sugar kinase [Mucilaginibacter frigoritolerans]TWI95567.1 2-dehydro-3-deoxygluconokinase [Mucilaginibacter frigoritolerans]
MSSSSNQLFSLQTGTVLSFGELLLRISLDNEAKWLKTNQLPFYVGGAELNVATALAMWDIPSKYLTAMPDNELSHHIAADLTQKHINVADTIYWGERLGLYFLTQGTDLKSNGVIYDRAHSSFAALKPGMINWDKQFDDVSWFHFSAICPAINENVAAVCQEALIAAKKKGIRVSIDLNYRSKLWKYGRLPNEVVPQLADYCDLIMGNIWAAETMLNVPITPGFNGITDKDVYINQALKTSQFILRDFPNCSAVANTFRFTGQNKLTYYTTLYAANQFYLSTEHEADEIVDPIGSGDCFMAGLIYGFYRGLPPAELLAFATTAAFSHLFTQGDANGKTVEQIIGIMV